MRSGYIRKIVLPIAAITLTLSYGVLAKTSFANDFSFVKQTYNSDLYKNEYKRAVSVVAEEESKVLVNERYVPNLPNYYLTTKSMDSLFKGESVKYLTSEGLKKAQVFIIQGKFYKTNETGKVSLYSSLVQLSRTFGDGEMIVMDKEGCTFIYPKKRGEFHHSSFFSGKPVAFAGLIFIRNGEMQELEVYSGHYTPGSQERDNFDRILAHPTLVKVAQDDGAVPVADSNTPTAFVSTASPDVTVDVTQIINGGKFVGNPSDLQKFVTTKACMFCNLRGLDLVALGMDLRNVTFQFIDLRGANFEGLNLENISFVSVDLTDALFTNANLTHAKFIFAELSGATFVGADITGADLSSFGKNPEEDRIRREAKAQ
jgi:hypothetical protein